MFLSFLVPFRSMVPGSSHPSVDILSGHLFVNFYVFLRDGTIHFEISTFASVPLTFSFAQLAKGKSLGLSKPATNSQAQALATHCVEYSTISKSYRTAFYRNKLSTTRCEWVRLFISRQSSLHIVAWDLDVERSHCAIKSWMMSNPVTQQRIC
jgi:hypothetical protein